MIYKLLKKIKYFKGKIELIELGRKYATDFYHIDTEIKTKLEQTKKPLRSEVINFLISFLNRETQYLEIGVRNPEDNFNKIAASLKISVDPGIEFKDNPVDYKMTSDDFFNKLGEGLILEKEMKFDIIFIDGLHLAEQVERDIINALKFIKEDGFIVLHDCNPPTQFHASEMYEYRLSPSKGYWNGTTWKAFYKYRTMPDLYSCCIDSDWGIGIISKTRNIGVNIFMENPFYEFEVLNSNRSEHLNLCYFEDFKSHLRS